jgi:hypothetical protein
MSDSFKTFFKALLEVVLLVSAAMLLCLFVPAMVLLELFLVLAGGLVLAAGVSALNNLIHNHKVQQMLREIELERHRRQLPPPGPNSASAPHHHPPGRTRRLRGHPCHR